MLSMTKSYVQICGRFIAHHPVVIVCVASTLTVACVVFAVRFYALPEFDDPTKGFETRGTYAALRLRTWDAFLQQEKKGLLSAKYSLKKHPPNQNSTNHFSLNKLESAAVTAEHKTVVRNKRRNEFPAKLLSHSTNHAAAPPVFCEPLTAESAHLVIRSKNAVGLLDVDMLHATCALEDHLVYTKDLYKQLCKQKRSKECCDSWSLGNALAFLSNTSCDKLTHEHIAELKTLLKECKKYYSRGVLNERCWERRCTGMPTACILHNVAFNIFHFLSDWHLQNADVPAITASFLPIHGDKESHLRLFEMLQTEKLDNSVVEVVALHINAKEELFHRYLLSDLLPLIGAITLISICVWEFTRSPLVFFVASIAAISSLSASYIVYKTFIPFFPFINMFAVVLLVGIAADGALLFSKIFDHGQLSQLSVEESVYRTLRHAGTIALASCTTTAVAFFSSSISNVTAICCFSVYSGLVILLYGVFLFVWLPPALVLQKQFLPSCTLLCNSWRRHLCSFVQEVIPSMIFTCHPILMAILTAISIVSMVFLGWHHGFPLPQQQELQLFESSNLLERYDQVFRDQFAFWREKEHMVLPLSFVWGVKPTDLGSYLDPSLSTTLVYDDHFDMSDERAQLWLLNFCQQLQEQPFFRPSPSPIPYNCFIVDFKEWMEGRLCDWLDTYPCCNNVSFPYATHVFHMCLHGFLSSLYSTPRRFFRPSEAGPRFDARTNQIRMVVVSYLSQWNFTFAYPPMMEAYRTVELWFQNELETAPSTMKNGWFLTDFHFLDLQRNLLYSTFGSVLVALLLSGLVMSLLTRNLLITLCALYTILSTVSVTMSLLVLLGWQLSVLESTTLSVSIGLAVDFTLHYAIAYAFSDGPCHRKKTLHCLQLSVGSISVAALTTGVVGFSLLFSNLKAYLQMGTYLVILMISSWVYSTFFFPSLLAVFSSHRCANLRVFEHQLSWVCNKKCESRIHHEGQK